MRKRCPRYVVLLVLVLAVLAPGVVRGAPFTDYTPLGWAWWCDGARTRCILLPDDPMPGTQSRFMILARDEARGRDWLIGWLADSGSAEITWAGEFRPAGGVTWHAQLAQNSSLRALIAASDGWTLGAVSDRWSQDAPRFNAVLRGDSDG